MSKDIYAKVSISQAGEFQAIGTFKPNPNSSIPGQPELLFKAGYMVHYRPDETLPEAEQYAEIYEA